MSINFSTFINGSVVCARVNLPGLVGDFGDLGVYTTSTGDWGSAVNQISTCNKKSIKEHAIKINTINMQTESY